MPTLNETTHAGGFILSEANGNRSRENGVLNSGQDLAAGTVLGQLLVGTGAAGAGNIGDGVLTVGAIGSQVLEGVYTLTCIKAGKADDTAVAAAGTSAAYAGNTGDGTITAAPATGAGAKAGVYRITCIEPGANVGTFSVQDPTGKEIGIATVGVAFATQITFTIANGATDFIAGDGFTVTVAAANSGVFSVRAPDGVYLLDATVGAAYASQHIGFTIADGATDFAVADSFTITVAPGAYEILDPAEDDGTQIAAGILYAAVDATSADKACTVIKRDAEVNQYELVWPANISAGNKATAIAQLKARGIILR